MQEDELVLSDVHLQVRSDKGEENCSKLLILITLYTLFMEMVNLCS